MVKTFKLIIYYIACMVSFTGSAQQQATIVNHQPTQQETNVLQFYAHTFEKHRIAQVQASLSVAPQAAISIGIAMQNTNNNFSQYISHYIHSMKIDIMNLLQENGPLTQKKISDMLWDSRKYPNLAYYSTSHHLNKLRDVGVLKHNKLQHSRESTWELISASQQEIEEKILADFTKSDLSTNRAHMEPSKPQKKQKMNTLDAIPPIPVDPSPLALEPTTYSWEFAHAPALPQDSFTADDTMSNSSNVSDPALPLPNPVNLLTMPSISFDWTTNRVTDLDNLDTADSHQEDF